MHVCIFFRGRGREGEKHQCERETDWMPLVCAPTGDRTHNLGVCPDGESNLRPFALRNHATQPSHADQGKLFFEDASGCWMESVMEGVRSGSLKSKRSSLQWARLGTVGGLWAEGHKSGNEWSYLRYNEEMKQDLLIGQMR